MRASLCAQGGLVWVARFTGRWTVVPHDPDGRALGAGFALRAEGATRPRVEAIAVDADRRVWVADSGAGRVRAFTAFGAELAGLPAGGADRLGQTGEPAGVDVEGVEDDALVLVASRGERLHALQLLRPDGAPVAALRSRGESGEPFRGLGRASLRGGVVHACEPATRLVQVFRRDRFHFAFFAPHGAIPEAVRPLADGRLVVATCGEEGSGVHLCDASGRLLRTLAAAGERDGEVLEPEDVAVVEEPGSGRRARVVVADRAGARIQVFNLEGACHGAFLADDGSVAVGDEP